MLLCFHHIVCIVVPLERGLLWGLFHYKDLFTNLYLVNTKFALFTMLRYADMYIMLGPFHFPLVLGCWFPASLVLPDSRTTSHLYRESLASLR